MTYRTVMQDVYSCPVPSGDQTIDQNDSLSNDVDIAGHVLDNEAPADPTTGTTVEDSSAGVTLPVGELSKEVYARNGVIGDTGPFTPGDEITYKLRYTLPHSDFEDLSLSDYLPLPVLRSDDWNADNTGGDTWTFSDQGLSKGNGSISASGAVVCDGASSIPSNTLVPASGAYTYGPGDTLHCSPGLSVVPEPPTTYPPTTAFVTPPDPVISVNPVANSLKFSYANYDVAPAAGSVVEVLFTLRVQDDPFADGLYLTNQLRTSEENSFNAATTQDAIVQFQINEPVLNLRKGVIGTDNVNSTLAPTPVVPAGVTVQGPGTCARLSGPVNSDNVGATFNSNLTNADAGDRVTYAIVVENAGSGQYGAFDVTIQDSLPAPLTTGHVSNLCVQLGDGSVAAYTGTVNDLFGAGGIQLVDIDDTLPTPIQGSLERGKLADGTPNLNGRNIAIITYDVVLPVAVTPKQTLVNTSKISNYASLPGGADFTEIFGEPTDDASVTMAPPAIDKTILSTNQAHTTDPNVAIGEIVTYQVVVTLPEGASSGAKLVDTLDPGLAYVDCISVAASSDLSTSIGTFADACNDPTNPTVAGSGSLITYDLGTVTNSNTDNTVPDTITFQYSAVVLNSTANNRGLPLNNAAAWQWDGGSVSDSAPDVIIVEPELDIQKSASPAVGDAGDVIDITLVVQHTGISNADAFDVTLSDVIPAGMTYLGSLDCTTGAEDPNACLYTAPATITANWDDFPDAGDTSIIKFQVTLDASVQSGQTIINRSDIDWTSLPDDSNIARSDYNPLSVERTGDPTDVGGGANDYKDSDTAQVKISGEPVKSIITTSEAHTGVVSSIERLAIGEIVRYKLVYRLPEGVDPNFQLLDRLPAGLQFLNDGTATVGFVANNGGITSSTITQANCVAGQTLLWTGNTATPDPAAPNCILPGDAVSSLSGSNDDAYGNGTDIYFKLGTLTNADRDADSEYVLVAFNALVLNVIGNQGDASNHQNDFQVLVNGSTVATSNQVNVRVVEPNIVLDKTVAAPSPLDAGDTIIYTLTFVNNATSATGADAFDIVLQDTLNSNLTLVGVTVFSKPTYATVDTSSTAAPLVHAKVDRLDQGDSITLKVEATVIASAPAGQIIPNVANLTYTSLEGSNGTTANPTGSSTPGAPGSGTGERTGDNGVGSGLNNYAATDNVSITLNVPAIVKQQPVPDKYTIGDQVVFDILVTLPEGVTKDLVVLDTLPAGLGYVSDDIFTTMAGDLSGLLTADFNGTLPSPTVSTTAGDGNDVSWTFGDTTNNVDDPNDTTNNSFVIRLTVVVQNVLSNQIGTILPNSAKLNYTNNNQPASIDGGTVQIEVIEPQITTTKTVVPTSGVEAGDTVNYTVRFANTGNSPAYDVVAVDTLAQGVAFASLVQCVDQNNAAVSSAATPDAPSAGKVTFQGDPVGSWDIPTTNPVSYIECQYTATVLDTVIVDGDHTNVVDADWSSQNDTTNRDERKYDDTPGVNVDGDQDEDDAVFKVDPPTFDKSDNGATKARIGDVINYTLEIGSPLGTLQSLTVQDLLPAGMIYLNDAAFNPVSGAITPTPAPTVSSPNDGSAPVALTWNFGNAVVSTSPIQITFSARVANVVSNQRPDVLVNNASMTWTNVTGTPQTLRDHDDFVIVEPEMTIAKTIIQGSAAPGDTVTVRIVVKNVGTSTAYEVTMQDVLPVGLTYAGGLDCTLGVQDPAPNPCTESSGTITAQWSQFLADGTTAIIEFQATVDAGVSPGAQIVNTAKVTEYSSLPDTDPNAPFERDYPEVEDSDAIDVVGGSIGNYIWLDENSDGYQDAGEPGIPNVTVNLYDNTGAIVATTVTDASGGYLFDNLPAGNYFVDVLDGTGGTINTLPAGMTQTTPTTTPAGSDFGNQDHNNGGLGANIPTTGFNGYPATVGGAKPLENLTADFGYNYNPSGDVTNPTNTGTDPATAAPAALGDRIWIDADGDGVQDPNEAGIAGVTVQLFTDSDGDGLYNDPVDDPNNPGNPYIVTTDANGNYIFDGLEPGAYVVQVTDTANVLDGYTQTGDPDHFGQGGGVNDGKTTTPVILAPGDVFLNADFGYQPPATENNSIGDTVWFDANADGVQGAGEPGIPGVTVALIQDTNGDGIWQPGEPIIASDTTDANGNYLFPGLPDGNYLVWVNDTDNVLGELVGTYDSNGGATATGSGAPTGVDSSTVLGLSASSLDPTGVNGSPVNDDTQDFGYTAPGQETGKGLIGDTIFLDADSNGQPDPGEGIEGVVVQLVDPVTGQVLATTTTDENGNYSFGGLPAGDYTVRVDTTTLPPGVSNTVDPDGGTLNESNVTIGGTEPLINLDQDFGYKPVGGPGSIGDLVWQDSNADGVSVGPNGPDGQPNTDDDEPGIEGVTIDLYLDSNGNGVIDPGEPLVGATVTDANGNYLFENLPVDDGSGGPVNYVVDVTDENGVLGGYWHSSGTPGADNNSQVDPYAVQLTTANPENLTADFGYYAEPAAVGNFVWNDLNDDGIQDSFEPGIADVEVKLTITYPDGTVVSVVTTTDSTGHYSFGNLLLDEDYNGDASSGPQPVYVITVATPAGFDHPSPIGTGDGMNDSNDPAGTTAEPTQGQTDTSAKANPSSESNPIAGYDFGFNDGTVLAVSLSYVNSERADDGTVSFIWETATETGNAGFNLFAQSNDVLSLVNAEMIPSSVIDSVTPVSYSYRATMDAEQFYIELISISGKSELHGPFTLGVAYGSPSDAPSGPDTGEMQKSLFLPTIRNE